MSRFPYTFGIEEEYFLSQANGQLLTRFPDGLLANARAQLGEAVTLEFLQSQIEIASPIFHEIDAARESMSGLRTSLARLVADMGFRLIAASTHPLGAWHEQFVTEKPRYDQMMSDFRIIGERNLVCGMHVHVAIPPQVDRVELMNRAMPWLPLFLALSASSPFWNRRVTGLMSYRQAVYDEWPRSGIPDFFADEADYQAFVAALQRAGAVKDASYLWWAIRPALRFPTLELRIADVCTRIGDGLALAALFRCLIATLVARPDIGSHRSTHTRRLIDENRWRAKRDGTAASFIDEASGSLVPLREVVGRTLELVADEAHRLGCTATLERLPQILDEGTSSQMQLRVYNGHRAAGISRARALRRVVEWLAEVTGRK
ncbi:MAG TPA: carboxylate-amine ligase [Steroidobacteraceae bacterium]|jgi:carboxylate-amine ligase